MKKTQVILLQRMRNLGYIGDTVAVRPGYARNFLFPQKIALRATPENKAYFEEKREYFETHNRERLTQAEELARDIKSFTLKIVRRASPNGHLYGSVSARDLVDYLAEQGIHVKQHQIELARPLKEIGVFPVAISFHADVSAEIFVVIARSDSECEAQIARLMESLKSGSSAEAAADAANSSIEITNADTVNRDAEQKVEQEPSAAAPTNTQSQGSAEH